MSNIIYPVIGAQTVLPFYLTGIGISEPEYHVSRETGLVSHQLMYTAEGEGELIVGGHSAVQKKGSLFYLPPGLPHEYYPLKDCWTTCWVVFRGEHAAELLERLGFGGYAQTAGADTERLGALFKRMLARAGDAMEHDRVSALLYEYILLFREQLFFPEKEQSPGESFIRDALRYIDSSYMLDITLPELSAAAGVSPQHFCRVFKAKLGVRPLEYIAKRRIAQAKLLLINTSLPVAEIGRQVGYSDNSYFGVVFRNSEGISPSEFRRTMTS